MPEPSGMPMARFAAVMGVHPAQVTRWAARGMPRLPDGTVDAEAAARWARANVDPTVARGFAERRAAAERPRDPVAAIAQLAARLALIAAVGRLPEVAIAAGAPVGVAYALHHAMRSAAAAALAEATAWCGWELEEEAGPLPELEAPDWRAMAEARGEPLDLTGWEAEAVARFGPLPVEAEAD